MNTKPLSEKNLKTLKVILTETSNSKYRQVQKKTL